MWTSSGARSTPFSTTVTFRKIGAWYVRLRSRASIGVSVGFEPTGSFTKGAPMKMVGSAEGLTAPRASRRRPTRT